MIKIEDSVAPTRITLPVLGQNVCFSIKYSGRKKKRKEAVSGIMGCWPVEVLQQRARNELSIEGIR